MKNCALLLIDIQNFYFMNEYCRLSNPEEAAKNSAKVLKYFRKNGMPVYFIKHCFSNEDNSNFKNAINDTVKPLENEKVIEKYHPSSFFNTSLKSELDKENIDSVVIVGMMTHMCVDTTVRACQDYGYNVKLISDACDTMDLEYNKEIIKAELVQKVFMSSLNGTFADVMKCEEFVNKKL